MEIEFPSCLPKSTVAFGLRVWQRWLAPVEESAKKREVQVPAGTSKEKCSSLDPFGGLRGASPSRKEQEMEPTVQGLFVININKNFLCLS